MAKHRRGAAARVVDLPAANGNAAETEDTGEDTGRRLNVQLGADGHIAWDRLRDRSRRELHAALRGDPRLAAELGIETPAGAGALDATTIGVLWGALGIVMATTAKAAGYPDDQAALLRFSQEEMELLAGPTLRVLSKYSPSLGRWEDEIMLAVTAASVIGAKVAALKKPARVLDIATGRSVTAAPVATEPEP